MIDEEWIKLIAEAKQLGLTIEEVRNFFIKNSEQKSTTRES